MAKARDYAAEYARRIARAEAKGQTRQQARGHKAHEHVERAEREREELGGLTRAQAKRVHEWASSRMVRQRSNAGLDPDTLVEWAGEHGMENYSKFRRAWEKQRREYKRNPRPKGSFDTIDQLFPEVDLEDLGVEWLYYH